LKAGDLAGLSIGYTVPPGGAERITGGRRLTKVKLHEVSVVAIPMNDGARVTSVKSGIPFPVFQVRSDLESWLQESGMPRRAAEKIARGGWPALKQHDEAKSADAAATLLRRIEAATRDLTALAKG
jgi:hypothetical protein